MFELLKSHRGVYCVDYKDVPYVPVRLLLDQLQLHNVPWQALQEELLRFKNYWRLEELPYVGICIPNSNLGNFLYLLDPNNEEYMIYQSDVDISFRRHHRRKEILLKCAKDYSMRIDSMFNQGYSISTISERLHIHDGIVRLMLYHQGLYTKEDDHISDEGRIRKKLTFKSNDRITHNDLLSMFHPFRDWAARNGDYVDIFVKDEFKTQAEIQYVFSKAYHLNDILGIVVELRMGSHVIEFCGLKVSPENLDEQVYIEVDALPAVSYTRSGNYIKCTPCGWDSILQRIEDDTE